MNVLLKLFNFKKMGAGLASILISKRMVFWVLEQYAKKTKNKYDDLVVKLTKELDAGNLVEAEKTLQELVILASKRF